MEVQQHELLTLPPEAVVDQVQFPATLPPVIQPPYQFLVLIKYAVLIYEKLRHQNGINIRPTKLHLSYCKSNGPKVVRFEVNAILFKGAGNDGRVISPMLADTHNKLAALVLKIKANLSPVPAIDNGALSKLWYGCPSRWDHRPPRVTGGKKFVIFISRLRFYIEQRRQNFHRMLPVHFTIELFCPPRLLVPQNFGVLCGGNTSHTLNISPTFFCA